MQIAFAGPDLEADFAKMKGTDIDEELGIEQKRNKILNDGTDFYLLQRLHDLCSDYLSIAISATCPHRQIHRLLPDPPELHPDPNLDPILHSESYSLILVYFILASTPSLVSASLLCIQ